MGNRLYVGNLSFSTTEGTLEAAFCSAGEVREVSLATDRQTGQSRGFAFVTMGNALQASTAVSQLNGSMLDGRSIKVTEAQERTGHGGGGYGGRTTGSGFTFGSDRGGGGRNR
jgi:cold-inducible RNA-binding protein